MRFSIISFQILLKTEIGKRDGNFLHKMLSSATQCISERYLVKRFEWERIFVWENITGKTGFWFSIFGKKHKGHYKPNTCDMFSVQVHRYIGIEQLSYIRSDFLKATKVLKLETW